MENVQTRIGHVYEEITIKIDKKFRAHRVKKEPEEKSIPIFINSSVISIDACHTVKANIQNGSKIYKLEKKFDVRRKAEMFIEQINIVASLRRE